MRHTLVYDADCGPCTRFSRIIGFLDTRRTLLFASLVDADSSGMLDTVPAARRHRSFHLVSPQGKVESGANALPGLIALLPMGRLPSELIDSSPFIFRSVAFVYSVFSRLHDSGSCSFKDHQEGTRAGFGRDQATTRPTLGAISPRLPR